MLLQWLIARRTDTNREPRNGNRFSTSLRKRNAGTETATFRCRRGVGPEETTWEEYDGLAQLVAKIGAVFMISDLTGDGKVDIFIIENGIEYYG